MVADNLFSPYSEWKVMEGTDEVFLMLLKLDFSIQLKVLNKKLFFSVEIDGLILQVMV
jgi:hypothetical protein